MAEASHAVRRPKWEVEQWWVLPMSESGTLFLTRERTEARWMEWVELKSEKEQEQREGEGGVMVSLEVYWKDVSHRLRVCATFAPVI
jgi:hypothetical protein